MDSPWFLASSLGFDLGNDRGHGDDGLAWVRASFHGGPRRGVRRFRRRRFFLGGSFGGAGRNHDLRLIPLHGHEVVGEPSAAKDRRVAGILGEFQGEGCDDLGPVEQVLRVHFGDHLFQLGGHVPAEGDQLAGA